MPSAQPRFPEEDRRKRCSQAEMITDFEHINLPRKEPTRKRPYDRERDIREKLFYLFLIAQVCAIFGMVVGVIFFILRVMKLL